MSIFNSNQKVSWPIKKHTLFAKEVLIYRNGQAIYKICFDMEIRC